MKTIDRTGIAALKVVLCFVRPPKGNALISQSHLLLSHRPQFITTRSFASDTTQIMRYRNVTLTHFVMNRFLIFVLAP